MTYLSLSLTPVESRKKKHKFLIPDSESKTNTSTSSDQESDNGKTSDGTENTVIENTEVIKTKDYDKNNSANTTITTDDTTTNREGETESVYKGGGNFRSYSK